MSWPYEEYTWWQNLAVLLALYIPALIVYFIVMPMMLRYKERRSGPIEEGTDVPHDEYWNE